MLLIQEIGNLCLLKYLGGNTFVAFQVSGDHCDLSVFQILFPDHSADSPCRFFQFFDGGFCRENTDFILGFSISCFSVAEQMLLQKSKSRGVRKASLFFFF